MKLPHGSFFLLFFLSLAVSGQKALTSSQEIRSPNENKTFGSGESQYVMSINSAYLPGMENISYAIILKAMEIFISFR